MLHLQRPEEDFLDERGELSPTDPPGDFGGQQKAMLEYSYRVPGSDRSGVRTAPATNSESGAWRLRKAAFSGN